MNLKNAILFLNQKLDKIRIPKNCILCECWILFKIPLCRKCRRFLHYQYKKYFDKKINIFNQDCFYLWEWNLQTEYWVQKIIISLKDGYNFELYKLFMSWLLKKSKPLKKTNFILAIPSLHRVHPETMIRSVHNFYPNLKEIILNKKDSKTQKNKSRFERLQTDFIISEKTLKSQNILNKKIIVFDDVLSTGGSFRGVKKALKGSQIEFIAVWAHRPYLSTSIETKNRQNCSLDKELAFEIGHEINTKDEFNFK